MKQRKPKAQSPKSKVGLAQAMVILAMLVCGLQSVWGQTTNPSSRLSYDSFRLISDRNIFNPNRYARSGPRPTTRISQPASRVESFTLVGTMAYERERIAFFDGTKDDYKAALQAAGKIGQYQITLVTPDSVRLVAGTNTYDVKVGMQMRREDEGSWFLTEASESAPRRVVSTRTRTRGGSRDANTSNDGADTGAADASPEIVVMESGADVQTTEGEIPAGNGNANGDVPIIQAEGASDNAGTTDPVLLRLMQRRQQLNQ